jgi:hypothetical protein
MNQSTHTSKIPDAVLNLLSRTDVPAKARKKILREYIDVVKAKKHGWKFAYVSESCGPLGYEYRYVMYREANAKT